MSKMLKKAKITSMDLLAQLMEQPLKSGKSVKFTVVGNSMYPVFRSGVDNVILSASIEPKIFDVILYKRENGDYVLHRIVGKGKQGFKLCGDNQLKKEYPVRRSDIIAVMTAFERDGKTIAKKTAWYGIYSVLWSLLIPLRPFMFSVSKNVKKRLKKGVSGICIL